MKIGIVDYGGGNLRSVVNAVRALGHDPLVVAAPDDAEGVTHLMLPGQGEFGDVMRCLDQRNLLGFLKNWILEDKPYFGICVGYQILFDASEEAPDVPGLSLIPGKVQRFAAEPELKIPHMGWNSARILKPLAPCWSGLGEQPYFYFIHSFFPCPTGTDWTVAETTYGEQTFACAVARSRVFACQFHPEKSQNAGLKLIENFLRSA
ncbi:MAG: imidazole glycerol phosphate synthase subunit HisH [Verrucomicrobia bacterium]|nr:MAG: imidazole glycerol phosphate synthase subunit HisH [Verrucomicrobiota bacterium]